MWRHRGSKAARRLHPSLPFAASRGAAGTVPRAPAEALAEQQSRSCPLVSQNSSTVDSAVWAWWIAPQDFLTGIIRTIYCSSIYSSNSCLPWDPRAGCDLSAKPGQAWNLTQTIQTSTFLNFKPYILHVLNTFLLLHCWLCPILTLIYSFICLWHLPFPTAYFPPLPSGGISLRPRIRVVSPNASFICRTQITGNCKWLDPFLRKTQ